MEQTVLEDHLEVFKHCTLALRGGVVIVNTVLDGVCILYKSLVVKSFLVAAFAALVAASGGFTFATLGLVAGLIAAGGA